VVVGQGRGVVQAAVPVNGVLTLQFRSDEHIVEAPLGDRSPLPEGESEPPWSVKIGELGTEHPLVHVRVTRPGLTTSLTVVTTKRLYVVDLKSVKSANVRVVRWPDEPPKGSRPVPRLLPDPLAPASYHLGYRVCPGVTRAVRPPGRSRCGARRVSSTMGGRPTSSSRAIWR
jgi:hypothetical protein